MSFYHVSRLMFSIRLRLSRVNGVGIFRSDFLESRRRGLGLDFSH